ncbi:MAG: hypothetical protein V1685_07165 [Parcubacteria group bacterium]
MDTQPKKSFFKRFRWLVVIFGLLVVAVAAFTVRGIVRDLQSENDRGDFANSNTQEQGVSKPTTAATLVLPFSIEDTPESIAPMGETIIHNNTPNNIGHSGIDFQWHSSREIKILASMDAEIMSIAVNPLGTHDVITERGGWSVEYDGMKLVNPELEVGQSITRGDYMGQPNPEKAPAVGQGFHWQFGYYDKKQNRAYPALCPLIYFNTESVNLIEKIWADTKWLEMKANAPDICSNYYKDKNQ